MSSTPTGNGAASPMIKEEPAHTPQPPSPPHIKASAEHEPHSNKAVASLKMEHGTRHASPLRESSVPVPTTELTSADAQATAPNPKKRPAPSAARTKKGTATTMKKGPAVKRRKLEGNKRDDLSATKRKSGHNSSAKGTPMNSSPAPSIRSQAESHDSGDSEEEDDDVDGDDDGEGVYCICRRPDNGTFMIGCDGTCDDWFHGKCVGIPESDKTLIDKYFCPGCTEKSIGRTSWKRVCRREGCRKPARVAAGSKYCSEDCGLLFFRTMSSRTRGKEEQGLSGHRSRLTSKNKSAGSTADGQRDLGARGGVLSAGEVRTLLDESSDVAGFQSLGNAVLSPPATPEKESTANGKADTLPAKKSDHEIAIEKIQAQKQDARRRHALLKDRIRFVGLVKKNATRLAAAKEVKSKDFCGYDRRLEWSMTEFEEWRESEEGRQIFEEGKEDQFESPSDVAMTDSNGQGNDGDTQEPVVCDRKRCMRHNDWPKLAIDEMRYEVAINSDRMRALEGEEELLKERALLRRVGKGEGWVEKHDSPKPKRDALNSTEPATDGLASDSKHETPEHHSSPQIPHVNGTHKDNGTNEHTALPETAGREAAAVAEPPATDSVDAMQK